MRTRSSHVVRATLVACGTIGLLASLATAQQLSPTSVAPVKKYDPSDVKRLSGQKTPAQQATGAKSNAGKTVVGAHAAGGATRGVSFADVCGSAPIVGDGTYFFDTSVATNDVTAVCGASGGPDAWVQYMAPATASIQFETCNLSSNDTVIAVYDACGGTSLACNDDSCGLQSRVTLAVTAGTSYWVRIGGFAGGVVTGSMYIGPPPPPPECFDCPPGSLQEGESNACDGTFCSDDVNGGCNSVNNPGVALPISVGQTYCGDAGTFIDPCTTFQTRDTDWYSFTLTEGTEVTWTVTAEFPVLIGLLNSGCPAGAFIPNTAFTSGACAAVSATVCLPAGTYYAFVAPSGFAEPVCNNGGEGTRYVASLSGVACAAEPPANDLCDAGTNPELFVGIDGSGDNTFAGTDITITQAQCTPFGSGGVSDVWHTFTAPADGCYSFETCGTVFDTHLSVWDGCPVDEFDGLLGCNDDSCGLQSVVPNITLTNGQVVAVRVASYGAETGLYVVRVYESIAPTPCVICPPGAIAEIDEECGLGVDDPNGGCNAFSLGVTTVSVGDTFCGTGAFDGALRDTDWYEFTINDETNVTLSVEADFEFVIAIINNICPPTVLSAFPTGFACAGPTSVTVCLQPGTYRAFVAPTFNTIIGCAGCNGEPAGNGYVATLTGGECPPPVPGDDCGLAEVVTVGTTFGSTLGALPSAAVCTGASPDWFYSFTPATSGTFHMETCGSSYDTSLAVYTDCSFAGVLACNDDFCGLQSGFDVSLTAGVEYFIRVGGFGGQSGDYILTIGDPVGPRTDDECDGAGVQAVSAGVVILGDNLGATTSVTGIQDADCGAFVGSAGGDDIWYTYTPDSTALHTIDLCGSPLDTVLAVYSGCPGDALSNLVACADDALPACTSGSIFGSRLDNLLLTGGTTYYISVGGYGGANGTFQMLISVIGAPTGACCTGGNCTVVNEADCTSGGGVWQGAGAPCNSAGSENTYSSSPNLPIIDNTCQNGGAPSDTIVVGDSYAISGIAVSVQIPDHTFLADLQITLSNGVNTVIVWDDQCGGNDGMDVTFRDGAGAVVCAIPTVGTYNPLNPLAPFIGQNVSGSWTLTVCDDAGGDTGTFASWSLIVNEPGAPACGPAFCDADWCQDGSVSVSDIFCFLADWFAGDPDATGYGGTNGVAAIFAYLAEWFATPQGPCTP